MHLPSLDLPRGQLHALQRLVDKVLAEEQLTRRDRQAPTTPADDPTADLTADPAAVVSLAAAPASATPAHRQVGPRAQPAEPGAMTRLLTDDLSNFGLPLALTLAFVAFLLVEGRIGGQPRKLTDARVSARRPLRFR